jgi:hypothetical protein
MAGKLPLNKVLGAMDRKQRDFYDSLTDEEKKAFSAFLMNRYASSVKGESALQEWWLIATNKRVNTHFFDLAKHPKLQWLLLTTASPGMGTAFHEWIGHKKKGTSNNNKIGKALKHLYPNSKPDEIEMLTMLNNVADVKKHLEELGYDDKQIKDLI